jgi:hypothetical protein
LLRQKVSRVKLWIKAVPQSLGSGAQVVGATAACRAHRHRAREGDRAIQTVGRGFQVFIGKFEREYLFAGLTAIICRFRHGASSLSGLPEMLKTVCIGAQAGPRAWENYLTGTIRVKKFSGNRPDVAHNSNARRAFSGIALTISRWRP